METSVEAVFVLLIQSTRVRISLEAESSTEFDRVRQNLDFQKLRLGLVTPKFVWCRCTQKKMTSDMLLLKGIVL